MGSSCTQSKTPNEKEANFGNIQNKYQQKNNKNHQNNINQTHLRHNEAKIDSSKPYLELEPDISKVLSKHICRIVVETQYGKITGTGFFLAFPINSELFYFLITNNHVIKDESINNNKIIYISYEEYKTASIKLNKNKRYIKSFIDKKLDITVVQLLDEDNISKKYFLETEPDDLINNELINKEIYIPQYIEGLKLKIAEGKIKDIFNYEFSHLANTQEGSSGSPIFLKDRFKVIGIHKAGVANIENIGDFIYPVINMIKEDIIKINNNGKYINNKYIYNDGKYYIGEFKNDIPNGKGIKYYKNGNILYEGDFINGKFEGNGKVIYENGLYYIGQFKNGLKHGKGTLYYSNGNIKYEGDWINDKFSEK